MSVTGKIRQLIDGDPRLLPRTQRIVLTAAKVNALRATPIVLMAAQGTGRLVQLFSSVLEIVPGSVAWTESADNLVVRYTDGSGVIVSQTIEMTSFITRTARGFTSIQPVVDGIVAHDGALNKPLVLHNSGDGEFGNSGNGQLIVHLGFRVWDVD
jgi:hypothetical protein